MATVEKREKTLIEMVMKKFTTSNIDVSDILGGSIFQQSASGAQTTSIAYSTLVNNYKSWVYTCIEKIAKTIASLPLELYVYKRGGTKLHGLSIKNQLRYMGDKRQKDIFLKQNEIEKVRIYNHPFLELINRPNKIQTRFILWMNIVIRLELSGTCGVYMPKNMIGKPGELWALPLTNTATFKVIPDQREVIKGYLYQDGRTRSIFDPSEIMFMLYPNPKGPFEGMAPLIAQQYPYDIDLYLMQQQYYMYRNRAQFGNIFTTEKYLNKKQLDEIKGQLHSDYASASRTGGAMFLHSGLALTDKGLAPPIKDMMIEQVAAYARDKLITSYDISPAKLGLVKGVNKTTITILDKTFYEECINPKTMLIEESFEKDLLPFYDESLTLDFKLPSFEDRELNLKERELNLKYGYTTINEERSKEDGLEPVEWGNKPWMPFNLTQVDGSQPQPQEPGEKMKLLDSNYWTPERLKQASEIFLKQVEQRKNILIPIAQLHFSNELKGVLSRLYAEGKAVKGHLGGFSKNKIRVWLKDNKNKLDRINIDVDVEADIFTNMKQPAITLIMQESGDYRLDYFDITDPFNTSDPAVEKWLGKKLLKFSKEVEGVTHKDINAILREGFQEGLPLTQIGENLKAKFAEWEKWRAQAISRTETISASNFADVEAVKQAGLEKKLKKFWLNEFDARETHQAAGATYNTDGAIAIDKDFFVGVDQMEAPANGALPEENINCRCTLGYREA